MRLLHALHPQLQLGAAPLDLRRAAALQKRRGRDWAGAVDFLSGSLYCTIHFTTIFHANLFLILDIIHYSTLVLLLFAATTNQRLLNLINLLVHYLVDDSLHVRVQVAVELLDHHAHRLLYPHGELLVHALVDVL